MLFFHLLDYQLVTNILCSSRLNVLIISCVYMCLMSNLLFCDICNLPKGENFDFTPISKLCIKSGAAVKVNADFKGVFSGWVLGYGNIIFAVINSIVA
mgnify:CR=1 FL=1